MKIEFDKSGVLITPGFHDGRLTGIKSGDSLELFLSNASGEFYRLIVPSLLELRADNYRKGNIVFEVIVHGAGACTPDLVKKLYGGEEAFLKFLPKKIEEITNNQFSILEISSSYGCDLLALFSGSLEIFPEMASTIESAAI